MSQVLIHIFVFLYLQTHLIKKETAHSYACLSLNLGTTSPNISQFDIFLLVLYAIVRMDVSTFYFRSMLELLLKYD